MYILTCICLDSCIEHFVSDIELPVQYEWHSCFYIESSFPYLTYTQFYPNYISLPTYIWHDCRRIQYTPSPSLEFILPVKLFGLFGYPLRGVNVSNLPLHFTNSTAAIFDLITLVVVKKNATQTVFESLTHTNAESIGHSLFTTNQFFTRNYTRAYNNMPESKMRSVGFNE